MIQRNLKKHPSPRPISLLAATALVVANMIGVGIFTSTGFMALGVPGGVPILIGWALGGVLALCGAAAYGELGAMMPRAGGEYVYLSEAYRPWVGFLSGWVSLIVGFSAPIAAASHAFGAYLHLAVPIVPVEVAAVVLILSMTAMHSASVVVGARVQTAFALAKVILIIVFVAAGFLMGKGDVENIVAGSGADDVLTGSFAVALVYIAFSYSGWNAAAYVAGEVADPGRNLPRALLIGTGVVTVLYIGLNLLFLYAAPAAELAGVQEVGELAARSLFGSNAGTMVSLLIALALVSSVSAMVMAGPRVYMAMAEDGLFFRFLAGRARTRGGAPVASIILQGALAIGLVLLATFERLINYIGFTLSISATLTVIAVFVLRVRFPERPRPYRTWGWPVTPLLFIALSTWMVVFLVVERPVESLAGVATLVLGGCAYLAWSRLGARRGSS